MVCGSSFDINAEGNKRHSIKPMGAYLKDEFGEELYIIGTEFNKGEMLTYKEDGAEVYSIKGDMKRNLGCEISKGKEKCYFIDNSKLEENSFVKNTLNSLMRSHNVYEFPKYEEEYIFITPIKAYDGIIYIYEITPIKPFTGKQLEVIDLSINSNIYVKNKS